MQSQKLLFSTRMNARAHTQILYLKIQWAPLQVTSPSFPRKSKMESEVMDST